MFTVNYDGYYSIVVHSRNIIIFILMMGIGIIMDVNPFPLPKTIPQ